MGRFNKLLIGVVLAVGMLCTGLILTVNADENTVLVLGTKESLVLDAPWDDVQVGYFPELNTSELTVECWVNPSLNPWGLRPLMYLVDREWSSPYGLWIWDIGTVNFMVNVVGEGPRQVGSVSSVLLNQWTHIAGTYSKTTGELKIYVNGILEGTNPIGAGKDLFTNSTDLWIGSNVGSSGISSPFVNTFYGLMDEVRVSNVARDPDEFLVRDGEYAQGYDDGYADGLAVNNADLLDMLPPGIRKNIEKQQGFAK